MQANDPLNFQGFFVQKDWLSPETNLTNFSSQHQSVSHLLTTLMALIQVSV